MAKRNEELNRAETQENTANTIKSKAVRVSEYLDEKKIPERRQKGVLAFLKLPKDAMTDRGYLDSRLKNYFSRVGGGV